FSKERQTVITLLTKKEVRSTNSFYSPFKHKNMKSKLKLAFDELEKELTLITQSELMHLMGGTGSSYSSGLSAESSIGDVVNYFTVMGFSFTQDSSGNYYMNGYANGSTGSISNGILI